MYSQVKFKFSIGLYNGSMGMTIRYNDRVLLSKHSFDTDTFTFTENLDLPGVVTIDLHSKGPLDTLVDSDGNIVADKYIKLEELSIDRVPLHILSLINLAEMHHDNQTTVTNYWGFNGQAKIKLEHSDSFLWHLEEIKKKTNGFETINS